VANATFHGRETMKRNLLRVSKNRSLQDYVYPLLLEVAGSTAGHYQVAEAVGHAFLELMGAVGEEEAQTAQNKYGGRIIWAIIKKGFVAGFLAQRLLH
jgi:hypothetical protein